MNELYEKLKKELEIETKEKVEALKRFYYEKSLFHEGKIQALKMVIEELEKIISK